MRPVDLIRYIGGLTVSQGRLAGEPFDVLPWERRFIRGAFAEGVESAALSIGRGNGKSTFTAAIACAALDGPLRVPRAETVVCASSFSQGTIIFDHVKAFLRDKLADRREWRIQDSQNFASIEHRASGAVLRCIGSDPRRAHGLAPSLVLADEPAQWPPGTADKMLAALETAAGKQPYSRFIALGTRPSGGEHWFSKMLAGGADYAQLHAAKPDDNPFRVTTWRKANPSIPAMPDLRRALKLESERAKRDSDRLWAFRALRLNLGTSDVYERFLISPEVWADIEGEAEREGDYVLALDLGQTAAMSAAAAFWPMTGNLESVACLPENPSLEDKGINDAVGPLYVNCQQRGELFTAGVHVSDIGALLRECLERWGVPAVIVCDRWREGELRERLESVNFPMTALVVRGQGFRDGAEDVRAFRAACLSGMVTPRQSLLLRAALAEARTVSDPAGNEKLAKSSEGGRRGKARDDAAAAAILAVAEGYRNRDKAGDDDGPLIAIV